MNIIAVLIAILGLSTDHVVLMVNQTGLKIVRIEIGGRRFEEVSGKVDQILVTVTPVKHDMLVVFKGGAQIAWPDFDFKNLREVIFYRLHDKIKAHPEYGPGATQERVAPGKRT